MTIPCSNIVLIGASSGGVDALLKLAAALVPDFPAPICVVQHIGPHRNLLPQLLMQRGPNRAKFGEARETPVSGTIYVAPPDHHMLIEAGRIRIWWGPKEQHTRPAIDPLFRSAALSFGPRAIGVVLSGAMDDGTAGLKAIKQVGGVAVVQDPAQASEPSMPLSALTHVAIDHVVTLERMAPLLRGLATMQRGVTHPNANHTLEVEHAASLGMTSVEDLQTIGQPSTFTCPDCGGVLFEVAEGRPVRFVCHTGHAYSLRALARAQENTVDSAMWASLRTLQEKQAVLRRLAKVQADERPGSEAETVAELLDLQHAIQILRKYVERIPGGGDTTSS
jgi:two-component system chemotaxis response regulator CheB